MPWISFGALLCFAKKKKKLDDSPRLDVARISRVPDASELVSFLIGLGIYQYPGYWLVRWKWRCRTYAELDFQLETTINASRSDSPTLCRVRLKKLKNICEECIRSTSELRWYDVLLSPMFHFKNVLLYLSNNCTIYINIYIYIYTGSAKKIYTHLTKENSTLYNRLL